MGNSFNILPILKGSGENMLNYSPILSTSVLFKDGGVNWSPVTRTRGRTHESMVLIAKKVPIRI
jgi:hypothetical protein